MTDKTTYVCQNHMNPFTWMKNSYQSNQYPIYRPFFIPVTHSPSGRYYYQKKYSRQNAPSSRMKNCCIYFMEGLPIKAGYYRVADSVRYYPFLSSYKVMQL